MTGRLAAKIGTAEQAFARERRGADGAARSGPPASSDEFYIGYEARMPPVIARAVSRAVGLSLLVAAAAAIGATLAQETLPDARFAYGQEEVLHGWLTRWPAPALMVREAGAWRRYWLVARGKFGAERELARMPDGWTRLSAARITRGEWRMLEIIPGSVASADQEAEPPPLARAAPVVFSVAGEIVDSKCYLGVMNPGSATAHRDCAVRCLSGGVPPMFAYRDASGEPRLALLLQRDGRRLDPATVRRAGTRLTLTGELMSAGDADVLVVGAP